MLISFPPCFHHSDTANAAPTLLIADLNAVKEIRLDGQEVQPSMPISRERGIMRIDYDYGNEKVFAVLGLFESTLFVPTIHLVCDRIKFSAVLCCMFYMHLKIGAF